MSDMVKRGRPPLPPEERRSYNMTMRIKPETRLRLAEAGRRNGRSGAREAEDRIQQSFDVDDIVQWVALRFTERWELK